MVAMADRVARTVAMVAAAGRLAAQGGLEGEADAPVGSGSMAMEATAVAC